MREGEEKAKKREEPEYGIIGEGREREKIKKLVAKGRT